MPIARSRALSPAAERALAEGRALLAELRDRLTRLPATEQDTTTLAHSIRQLDDFFLLVVVGEFNAGKSAVINALLGERVLEEGVTPTTAHISWYAMATGSRGRSTRQGFMSLALRSRCCGISTSWIPPERTRSTAPTNG